MPVSQTVYMQARGLQTASSQIDQGEAPGFLSVAQNLVINHQGLWEPRRGIGLAVDASEFMAESMFSLVAFGRHVAASSTDGALTLFDASTLAVSLPLGTVLPPLGVASGAGSPGAGFVRGAEGRESLFLASESGVQALESYASNLRPAGLPTPFITDIILSTVPGSEIPANTYTAWRVVLAHTDVRGLKTLSAPSNLFQMFNGGVGTAEMGGMTIKFVGNIPSGCSLQFYRTLSAPSSAGGAGDEEFLASEVDISSSSGYRIFFAASRATQSQLGAALYTNASQEGATQANDPPPYCFDIATYRGFTFFAAAARNAALQVERLGQLSDGQVIQMPGGTVTFTTGATSVPSRLVHIPSSPATANLTILQDLELVVNSNSAQLGVTIRWVGAGDAFVVTSNTVSGESRFQGLSFGALLIPGDLVAPMQQVSRLAYSKFYLPEAVPVLNFVNIGASDKAILRLLPLRDALFILKEDGIWRLTGTSATDLDVQPYNLDLFLAAPNSLVALHNSAIGLFNHGMVRFTDSETENIGLDVDDLFKSALEPAVLAATASLSWGMSYPSERQYWISLPRAPGDTGPTASYVWSERLKQWTGPMTKVFRAGLVHPGTNQAFLGGGTGLYLERKTGSIRDFSDYVIQAAGTVASFQNLASGNVVTLADMTGIKAGDVISQASGAVYATILELDHFGRYCLVDTARDWNLSVGSTQVHEGIPVVCQWSPAYGRFPGASHRWREASLLFKDAALAQSFLAFGSDLDPLLEYVRILASDHGIYPNRRQGRNIRALVPAGKQRGNNLVVSFEHCSGWAPFQLQGMSLIVQNVSERTGR